MVYPAPPHPQPKGCRALRAANDQKYLMRPKKKQTAGQKARNETRAAREIMRGPQGHLNTTLGLPWQRSALTGCFLSEP